jgi:hypothetical protein
VVFFLLVAVLLSTASFGTRRPILFPLFQPKETGVNLMEINNYTWLDDHTNHMNIKVQTYQWYSYAGQTVISQGTGLLNSYGKPTAPCICVLL